jgi:hypothetical protein
MNKLLFTAPEGAMPKPGTQAHKLLSKLEYGHAIPEMELAFLFNSNQRSAIQDLGSDSLQNWNILPIEDESGKIVARQLDPRHLSGDPILDLEARRERRLLLKKRSHKQAHQGRVREPKAYKELNEVESEMLKALGNAANDCSFKKPTQG